MPTSSKSNVPDCRRPGNTRRMREFAGEICTVRNIAYRVDDSVSGALHGLGPDRRRHLFLIFKEAVRNAARHSGCTSVNASIFVEGHSLVLEVEDDGHGFENGDARGNGLTNMRRRAEAMLGTLEVGYARSGGAKIRAKIPVR